MHVTILGEGSWGSAMGRLLRHNGHTVEFLHRQDEAWPGGRAGDLVFLALPCQSVRGKLRQLPVPGVPVVSLIKGLEVGTGLRVSEVVNEIWPGTACACISGPSLAAEVQAGAPTAAVVAAREEALAELIQTAVHQKLFRLYRSTDLKGVELGGALKNVYALAGGICAGLSVGENGMAGLMTRSLAEMVRIAVNAGARVETLYGLSGMGDLILTAYSGASRNHQVGEALGRGRELEEILKHLAGTAEGVPTTLAVCDFVNRHRIKAPVVQEIYHVLYEHKSIREAFDDLLLREVGGE
jgi:glycerol-3-phosphate dehydrogenase (NAD(P)+)